MHASDISSPIKPFPIYKLWTEKVLQEYWNQVTFFLKIYYNQSLKIFRFS